MATYISVTNTFSSGAVAASGEVNTNFTDIVNGLSDGTKDIHVRDVSITSAIVTGNVSVGRDTFEGWDSAVHAFQLGDNGVLMGEDVISPGIMVGNNWYWDGTNYKYIDSDKRTHYIEMDNSALRIGFVASGTADAAFSFNSLIQFSNTVLQVNAGLNAYSFVVSSDTYANAFHVDGTNDKLYSDILKTTSTTAVSMAYVLCNLSTGEIFSQSGAPGAL